MYTVSPCHTAYTHPLFTALSAGLSPSQLITFEAFINVSTPAKGEQTQTQSPQAATPR